MPFTFSHPALVLPFKYLPTNWFSFTGLLIGAVVPDFEYFIRMRVQSSFSHTPGGIFWFDLPLGLLLAFIFHNNVKCRLITNLPRFLQSRLEPLYQFKWNRYFVQNWHIVIISIIIGTITHLLWDSFTHHSGYFVQRIPWLSQETIILGRQVHISNIIQHLSTLLGGLILVFAIRKLPQTENFHAKMRLDYWAIIFIIVVVIVSIRFLTGLSFKEYGNVIVTIISAGLVALMITPLLMKRKLTDDNIGCSQWRILK
jgi:hypothetical protein